MHMCTHVCIHMCIFMKRHTHTFKITGSPVSPNPIHLQGALSHPLPFCNLDVASFMVRSTPSSNDDTCSPSAVVYPRRFQNDCTHTRTMANVQKKTVQVLCAVSPTPPSCTRLKSCTYIFEVKYSAQMILKSVFSFFFP